MAAAKKLSLKLVSLLGEKASGEAYEVILPSKAGEVAILPDHEPLITLLFPGVVAVRREKGDPDSAMELFVENGGVVKIRNNHVTILTDEAETDREISEKEAEQAHQRAKQALAEAKDQIELEEARRVLLHQAARLKVANLRRKHRDHPGKLN